MNLRSSRVACLAAFSALTFAAVANEFMSITDQDGNTLLVRPVGAADDSFTFLRQTDNKRFTVPLERLNEASRKTVDEWIERGGHLSTKYEVSVSTGKTRKKTGREDFDDKAVNIEPIVTIKNPDNIETTRGGKLTAIFLGRSVNDRGAIYVFKTQTFDLPALAPTTASAFQLEAVTHQYDDTDNMTFGSRYLGYVILIHDPKTKEIIHAKSVPAALANRDCKAFLKLQDGLYYDDDTLEPKEVITYKTY